MSRWKETLCGKAITPKQSAGIAGAIPEKDADIMSCGGIFLGKTSEITKNHSLLFHLPKNRCEVMVINDEGLTTRYLGSRLGEIEETGFLENSWLSLERTN